MKNALKAKTHDSYLSINNTLEVIADTLPILALPFAISGASGWWGRGYSRRFLSPQWTHGRCSRFSIYFFPRRLPLTNRRPQRFVFINSEVDRLQIYLRNIATHIVISHRHYRWRLHTPIVSPPLYLAEKSIRCYIPLLLEISHYYHDHEFDAIVNTLWFETIIIMGFISK